MKKCLTKLARPLLIAALIIPAAASLLVAGSPASPEAPNYHLVRRILLGGAGSWDYMTLDNAAHRLYVTDHTHVMVVNPGSGKVVGNIPDTQGVHGVALDPELGLGFTSNGEAASVTTFNLKTLKTIRVTHGTGNKPDCIVYDPASRLVFTFNGKSDSSTVIDPATGKIVKTISLGGEPEFAVADGKGNIFNNITDKEQLIRIDTHNLTVVNRWPLGCGDSTGLSIDYENRRLFVGCRDQHMQIVNADTGHVIASLPIGKVVDATRYDPVKKLAFASNGGGTVTVVRELSPDDFKVVQTVDTQLGARTMELDPKTHNFFVVTAKLGSTPAATADNPHPRPTIIPGTLVLLKYAP
ncbi:MAG: YncE family protein [Terriglobia bacterium]